MLDSSSCVTYIFCLSHRENFQIPQTTLSTNTHPSFTVVGCNENISYSPLKIVRNININTQLSYGHKGRRVAPLFLLLESPTVVRIILLQYIEPTLLAIESMQFQHKNYVGSCLTPTRPNLAAFPLLKLLFSLLCP